MFSDKMERQHTVSSAILCDFLVCLHFILLIIYDDDVVVVAVFFNFIRF